MAKRAKGEPPQRPGPRDAVDDLVGGWRAVRSDLDVTPVEVVARLSRLRVIIEQHMEALFAEFDLTAASFSALAAIARLEGPDGVAQVTLMRELRLTSGTISVRIDRLVADGLARREADPDDRRGARITLTARGRDTFERAAPAHLDNERRLLAALSPDEQGALAGLLRKLLIDLDGAGASGPDPARRLGATLASAHETGVMRRAVGLADRPGLLVRAVDRDGPAALGGVVSGDLVVAVGGRDVRSLMDVHEALQVADNTEVVVDLVRGARATSVTLSPV
jgi:DNA-binding MarR family transcriptional regulator